MVDGTGFDHYAAPLMGEMAIAELQSKRRPRPWER